MKDWIGNKNSPFTMLGSSSHSMENREENDFYATDKEAINKLFNVEEFDNNIWECACGDGELSKRMIELGKNVISTDLIDRGYGLGQQDFLKAINKFDGDIITNPPYKYITEFILKALELTKNKVAMFCKLTTLESQNRYEKIFKKYPPKTIYVFSRRISCYKNNDRTTNKSSAVCYAWFIWEKDFYGEPIIRWL